MSPDDPGSAIWLWSAGALTILLCALMTLMAYVRGLYVEMLHFRARERPQAFEFFEDDISERLGWAPEDGRRRFAFLSQVATVLLPLTLVVVLRTLGIEFFAAAGWAAAMALTSLVFFGHTFPVLLMASTRGQWLLPLLGLVSVLGWLAGPVSHSARWATETALSVEDDTSDSAGDDEDDIDVLLDAGEEEGLLDPEDRELIESVVSFNDKQVAEVMTPRSKVIAVEAATPISVVQDMVREHDYSRMPVYRDSLDDMIGVLHGRDAMLFRGEELGERTAESIMRDIQHVPETKLSHRLLRDLQRAKQNMAAVIDEYGNLTGIVTIEDIVEEIVGEIPGEDPDTPEISRQADGSYLVDGGCELAHLSRVLGRELNIEAESSTLSGLACEVLGKMPGRGAKFEVDGVAMQVLATDGRRVTNLRVWPTGA